MTTETHDHPGSASTLPFLRVGLRGCATKRGGLRDGRGRRTFPRRCYHVRWAAGWLNGRTIPQPLRYVVAVVSVLGGAFSFLSAANAFTAFAVT
jgi:hypothetical protein